MSLTVENCTAGAASQTFVLHTLPSAVEDYTYHAVIHVASGLCATAVRPWGCGGNTTTEQTSPRLACSRALSFPLQQDDGSVALTKCANNDDYQAWVCGASGRVCLDKVNSECITVYVESPPETPPELDRFKY